LGFPKGKKFKFLAEGLVLFLKTWSYYNNSSGGDASVGVKSGFPKRNPTRGDFMIIVKSYPHPDDWQKADPSLPLHEMAYPEDKVEQKLTQFAGTIFTHLLKLFYFRDFSAYFNNWSSAVFKSAFSVHKIKRNRGKDR
jgi:hypothetical protein